MNFSINLAAVQTFPGIPWEFKGTALPEDVRKNKVERSKWILRQDTQWNVYSLVEGINSGCRIQQPRDESEGNPPKFLYGFVGDYDYPASEEEITTGLARLAHKPNWMERTLSGHVRFLWVFAERLALPPDAKLVREFLEWMVDKLDLKMLVVGFDQGAFVDPARRFTNSGEWRQTSESKLSPELVQGWFVQFLASRRKKEAQYDIPFEKLAERLREQFPRFAEWPGEFQVGAQGPTFWVDGSTSPTSAIVRPDGMFTFAAHANDRPFWSWSELCGADWTETYKTEATGKAVDNIWHDGQVYWRIIPCGKWKSFTKEDTILHLSVERNVSQKRDKKTSKSPMEEALLYIQQSHAVDGGAPFLFKDERVVEMGPHKYLNLATNRIISPVSGKVEWNEQNFPVCFPLLTRFLATPEQNLINLCHLALFYRSGYYRRPSGGQAVFIAGVTGVGKTLFGTVLVPGLMGGGADAGRFLKGEDTFGSHLFWVPVWHLDDATSLASESKHRHLSEALKAVTANQLFQYHAKFRVPTLIYWAGRVYMTLNCDEESLRQLPNTSISNKDKIHLFRTADKAPIIYPARHVLAAQIARELPLLARVLLDLEIPQSLMGDARYGLLPFHDESLLQASQQSSPTAAFHEIFDDWRTEYFKAHPEQKVWEGTSFQLHKNILTDTTAEAAMKNYSIEAVGRALASLKAQGLKIDCRSEHGKRVWSIPRPEGVIEIQSTVIPEQKNESKFSK